MLQINNVHKAAQLNNNKVARTISSPSFTSSTIQDTFTKTQTPKEKVSFSGATDVFKHRKAKNLMRKDKALKFNVEHAMGGHLWAVRNLKESEHLETVKPYIIEELIKNTAKSPDKYKAQALTQLDGVKVVGKAYLKAYGTVRQNEQTTNLHGILNIPNNSTLANAKAVIKLLVSDTNPLKEQAIEEYLQVAKETLNITKENLVLTNEKMLAVKIITDYGNSMKDVETLKTALTNPKTPHYAYPSIATGIGTLVTKINPSEEVKEALVKDLRDIANKHCNKDSGLSNKIVTACYKAIETIKGRL